CRSWKLTGAEHLSDTRGHPRISEGVLGDVGAAHLPLSSYTCRDHESAFERRVDPERALVTPARLATFGAERALQLRRGRALARIGARGGGVAHPRDFLRLFFLAFGVFCLFDGWWWRRRLVED